MMNLTSEFERALEDLSSRKQLDEEAVLELRNHVKELWREQRFCYIDTKGWANAQTPTGITALRLAVSLGDEPSIHELLLAKANVRAQDVHGWTVLHTACRARWAPASRGRDRRRSWWPTCSFNWKTFRGEKECQLRVLRLLLEARASCTEPATEKRVTPLMCAVRSHNLQLVQTLLDASAAQTVNCPDLHGFTALMHAVHGAQLGQEDCQVQICKLLLVARGDTTAVAARRGVTPLMCAVESGSGRFVRTILDANAAAAVDVRDENGETALMRAARVSLTSHREGADAILQLVRNSADVNVKSALGQTALELLLGHHVSTHLYGGRDAREERWWQMGRHLEILNLLVASAADVAGDSYMPLEAAVDLDDPALVRTFLSVGQFSPSALAGPLHASITKYLSDSIPIHREILDLLLSWSADVSASDVHGRPALIVAVSAPFHKHEKVRNPRAIAWMSDMAATAVTAMDSTSLSEWRGDEQIGRDALTSDTRRYVAVAKALLYFKANPCSTWCGVSALMWATTSGSAAVVRILLSSRADVSPRDLLGRTVLHYAAMARNAYLVKSFLEVSSRLALKTDNSGKSPLMCALQQQHHACVNVLLPHSNIHERNCKGKSVLMYAAELSDSAMLQLVLAERADVQQRDRRRCSAMHYAAAVRQRAKPNVDCLLLLDASSADLTALDCVGRTPLHYAVASGNYVAVLWMLGNGETSAQQSRSNSIDVNACDQKGVSPLVLAARSGNFLCAEALVNAKAHVQQGAPNVVSALEEAVPRWPMVELLLQNATCEAKSATLLRALSTPNLSLTDTLALKSCIEGLLLSRADPDAQDYHGRTSITLAVQWCASRKYTVEFDFEPWLHGGLLSLLVRRSRCINLTDFSRRTALSHAITSSPLYLAPPMPLLVELLEAQADANIIDVDGWTALMYAAARNYADAVCALLRAMREPVEGKYPLADVATVAPFVNPHARWRAWLDAWSRRFNLRDEEYWRLDWSLGRWVVPPFNCTYHLLCWPHLCASTGVEGTWSIWIDHVVPFLICMDWVRINYTDSDSESMETDVVSVASSEHDQALSAVSLDSNEHRRWQNFITHFNGSRRLRNGHIRSRTGKKRRIGYARQEDEGSL